MCAPLVQANNGNFYGTTNNSEFLNGVGTFFEITPSGTFTTRYDFCSQPNCADGPNPAGFVQGTDGNFYGVAVDGGGRATTARLFKITPTGSPTTLHRFTGTYGSYPTGLVQHTNGTFYGEANSGGTSGSCQGVRCGTLFSLSVGLGPFVETLPTSAQNFCPNRLPKC